MNLRLPTSWSDLDDDALTVVLKALSSSVRSASPGIRAVFRIFLSLSGLKIVCRYADGWLLRPRRRGRRKEFLLTHDAAMAVLDTLRFILSPPQVPVRISSFRKRRAVAADLSDDFSFDSFLACDAIYQAFIPSGDLAILDRMAPMLYPGLSDGPFPDYFRTGLLYWWAALKSHLSTRFPDLFVSAAPAGGSPAFSTDDMRKSIDAQLRALTKGDVCREAAVLAAPALRALTELDALAREYREYNLKYGKS